MLLKNTLNFLYRFYDLERMLFCCVNFSCFSPQSQGNVKSPPKSEEIASNKQSKTLSNVKTFENTISDTLTQIENEIGPERSQTQELPITPSKESTKHNNEADELPQKYSSVKETSNKGSDTSTKGLTQKKSFVKETPSKDSIASEATTEGSTRKKSSVKEISSKGSVASEAGSTRKKSSVKEVNAAESKQKLKEKIKQDNEKNKAAREEKYDNKNEKENEKEVDADDEQERRGK